MRSIPYLLFIASLGLSVQLLSYIPMTYAVENLDRFWSVLTGDQQTPPVTTDAIGYVGQKSQDVGQGLCIVFMQNISER